MPQSKSQRNNVPNEIPESHTIPRKRFKEEFSKTFVANNTEIADQVWLAAQSKLPVLINGPTGTGKELVAEAIHNNSSRRKRPWVAVNCGLIPREHIYSELFGVEKWAFTGVPKTRKGFFEEASGSTIFLDEIGEMPLDAQAGLLRVLETGRTKRLGEDESQALGRPPIDVRIIAATNIDIWDSDKLRPDLLHRLKVIPIFTPKLQSPGLSIPVLIKRFLSGHGIRTMDFHFFAFCCSAPWEGNVRELKNFCEYAALRREGEKVTLFPSVMQFFRPSEYCPSYILEEFTERSPNFNPYVDSSSEMGLPFGKHTLLSTELLPYLSAIQKVQTVPWIGKDKFSPSAWFSVKRGISPGYDLVSAFTSKRIKVICYRDFETVELPDSASDWTTLMQSSSFAVQFHFRRVCESDRKALFESDLTSRSLDDDSFSAAFLRFEKDYYREIFRKYQNLNDHKIGKLIGRDRSTVKQKRRLYAVE